MNDRKRPLLNAERRSLPGRDGHADRTRRHEKTMLGAELELAGARLFANRDGGACFRHRDPPVLADGRPRARGRLPVASSLDCPYSGPSIEGEPLARQESPRMRLAFLISPGVDGQAALHGSCPGPVDPRRRSCSEDRRWSRWKSDRRAGRRLFSAWSSRFGAANGQSDRRNGNGRGRNAQKTVIWNGQPHGRVRAIRAEIGSQPIGRLRWCRAVSCGSASR